MGTHWVCLLLLMALLAASDAKSEQTTQRWQRVGHDSVGGVVCSNSSFTCKDGRCIPPTWRCDGDFDCSSQEDEQDCHCNADEFECGTQRFGTNTKACIPLKWKCDGEFDCDDRSDEAGCGEIKCKDNQFTCSEFDGKFKLCIPKTWQCDGQKDCASGADEKDCEKEKKCEEGEFDCKNAVCIFPNWRCDGEDDCGNGEDEKGCDKSVQHQCNSDHMFKCASGDGCVPKDWQCDGEPDCHDRSDELGCKKTDTKCQLPTEFACESGHTCINRLWQCDGEADCPDKSDEKDCKERECASGEKQCDNKQCMPESLWCDGSDDCPGGEDEKGCPAINATESPTCKDGDYTCPSAPAMCVPFDKLCTSKSTNNCGTDETCSKNITFCNNGADSCNCRKMYDRNEHFVCHCKEGFISKNNICIDVDECSTPGRCDQMCKNVPGSYECSCHAGYKLTFRDNEIIASKCRALGGDPLVLLSNRATIRQFDLVTHAHLPLIQSPGSAVAMDFHMNNGTLIWSDISLRRIMTCQIGNASSPHAHLSVNNKCADGGQSVLVEGDVHTPDGLAVDWIHDLLFWTDGALDQVSVMDLKTRKRRVLFHDAMEEPRAIAVDPEMGLIFWTDWGKEARIERAGMDGAHRKVILKGEFIKWPNGLALDLLDKRLYWADAKVKSIFSSDYYGKDIKVVLHSHTDLRHPFSLAIFEDRVYYTDWEHDGVISVNKFTGAGVTKLMTSVTTPMTVRIYHRAAQPEHPNKCIDSNCGELCLPKAVLQNEGENRKKENLLVAFSCLCQGDALSDRAECIAELVTGSHGFSLGTMTLLLVLSLALVGVFVVMRQRRRGSAFSPLTFDNPVYRRTVEEGDVMRPVTMEEVEVPMHASRLQMEESDRNTMIEPMSHPLTT